MNTNQKLRTFDLIREAVLPEYRDRVAEYLVLYEEALHDANARPDEVRCAANQLKDLVYASDAAERLEAHAPLTRMLQGVFDEIVQSGEGEQDHSVVLEHFRRGAGRRSRASAVAEVEENHGG